MAGTGKEHMSTFVEAPTLILCLLSFCRVLDGTFLSEFHWEMPNHPSVPAGKLHLNTLELVGPICINIDK